MTAFDEPPVRSRRRWLIWSGAIVAAVLLGAAALVIREPWRAPTPPMATTLPNSCPALLGVPGPESGGGIDGTGPGEAKDADCTWGTATMPGFPPLRATTALYPSIDEAQRQSAAQVTVFNGPTHGLSLGADTPITGVGDEARISNHDGLIILVARKANVVLTMQYMAPRDADADESQALLATAARTILAGITLTTTA